MRGKLSAMLALCCSRSCVHTQLTPFYYPLYPNITHARKNTRPSPTFLYWKWQEAGPGLGTRLYSIVIHLAENLIASWSDHLLLVRGHWLVYWWEVSACTQYIKWHRKETSGRLRYYSDVLENLVLLVFLMQPTHVLSWTDLKLCMTHILSNLVSMPHLAFSRLQYKLNRDWEWGNIIP